MTRRWPPSRPPPTSTRSRPSGWPTRATARRWRWPTARSARCRPQAQGRGRPAGRRRPARRCRPALRGAAGRARGRARRAGAGRGGRRRHAAVRPASRRRAAPADHADGADRRRLRRAWATRSPRAPRSRPSGSTSTPSTSRPTTRPARCRTRSSSSRRRPGVVLRTHTSPVQARTMLTRDPPIYVICPGRVYRTDELDATHTPGVPPGRGPRRRRGHHDGAPQGHARPLRRPRCSAPASTTRLRPSYFPFTEPSAEVDVLCFVCRGTSVGNPDAPCRTCWSEGWIEWGGCGMVNPRVLRRLRHRPRRLLRLRVRHGRRADADVPPRRRGHARHGRGRRAVHPRVRIGGL